MVWALGSGGGGKGRVQNFCEKPLRETFTWNAVKEDVP
jgi:hypothetical protein